VINNKVKYNKKLINVKQYKNIIEEK